MQRHFCTYFDHRYLPKGLALYHSLRRHCPDFTLWVLALTPECSEILSRLALPGIEVVSLAALETAKPALCKAKSNRSPIEYYFTCTPTLCSFLLEQQPEIDIVTYLDADLCFFSDPEPLFAELGERSVAIIGHRFPPHLKHLEDHGLYNVGWVSFRNAPDGRACLAWWETSCLEWCYDRVVGDRYADQKYLDRFPERFSGVAVLQHPGADIAPWNIGNSAVSLKNEEIFAGDRPLIFYHFEGLKRVLGQLHNSRLSMYGQRMDRSLRDALYRPYLQSIREIERGLEGTVEHSSIRFSLDGAPRWRRFLRWAVLAYSTLCCLLKGDAVHA